MVYFTFPSFHCRSRTAVSASKRHFSRISLAASRIVRRITSFEEQMKSPDTVKATFLADIDKLFAAALSAPEIAGIIVNPWHCPLQLEKELIRIIQPGRAG